MKTGLLNAEGNVLADLDPKINMKGVLIYIIKSMLNSKRKIYLDICFKTLHLNLK